LISVHPSRATPDSHVVPLRTVATLLPVGEARTSALRVTRDCAASAGATSRNRRPQTYRGRRIAGSGPGRGDRLRELTRKLPLAHRPAKMERSIVRVDRPVVLVVLDGWGHRESTDGNAIAMARTPTWDRL